MLNNIRNDYYEPTKYVLNNKKNNKKNKRNKQFEEKIETIEKIEPIEENECFICYENNFDKIIKLNTQCFYFKTCKCNGYIHKKCLDVWFETTSKCPICRNFISKITNITNIESKNIYLNYYVFIIYVLCKNNFEKIIRFLFVITFFYYTSEQYINIFKNKTLYKNHFKNEYNYNCFINTTDINIDINYIIPFTNVIIHPTCFD
jgi:hypothetical protein